VFKRQPANPYSTLLLLVDFLGIHPTEKLGKFHCKDDGWDEEEEAPTKAKPVHILWEYDQARSSAQPIG